MEDTPTREKIWQRIEHEFNRSRSAVLAIKKTPGLLSDIPWFEQSLRARNPYVDPLNLMQVELFRRLRKQGEPIEQKNRLQMLLRLTIKGVAAGMRTTG
jgi:phosphoenolpyruvate carboxylase